MNNSIIEIFSDGSCNTQFKAGAWVAILICQEKEIILSGFAENTTNNRMELSAVIEAIDFADKNLMSGFLKIYTDSQYVTNITLRKEKLAGKDFHTNKGMPIQNSDLVQKFIRQIESHDLEFIKVKAHQKFNGEREIYYNREVDKLARKSVRESVCLLLAGRVAKP